MPMPDSLRLSLISWTLAIAAGVAETGLAVTPVITADGLVPELLPALALRGLLYGDHETAPDRGVGLQP